MIRYTVPQRISSHVDTTVYFRVADVYRDKKITVRDGDKVVFEKRAMKLAPGEMESITLKAELLSAVSSGELKFSLEDAPVKKA